jgi:peptide/nickel transport system permease protein
MSLLKQTLRRLGEGIPTLFGLSILMFALTRLVPGDPVRVALGEYATEEEVQQLRAEMGLDEPLYVQYIDWLTGIFQLDWGTSLQTRQNVYTEISATFPATLELVLVAVLFAVLLAVPFGVIAATNKDQWPDHLSRVSALVGVSMPRFWLGIVLQVLVVVWLGLFPLTGRISGAPPPDVTGLYLVDSLIAGQMGTFIDALKHIFLPAITLSVGTLAQVMRLVRSDMIDESRKEYILAARAYGLPTNLITYKYMLKNAFSSSLTIIGLAIGVLLGGAFVVEIVFAWPGMARFGVRSIQFQDYNAVMGVVMVVGVVYLIANFLVDVLYAYLDPRLRMEEN